MTCSSFNRLLHEIPDVRVIVVYTGDVESAEAVFETKCMTKIGRSIYEDAMKEGMREENC